jgi:hypothetical protein
MAFVRQIPFGLGAGGNDTRSLSLYKCTNRLPLSTELLLTRCHHNSNLNLKPEITSSIETVFSYNYLIT